MFNLASSLVFDNKSITIHFDAETGIVKTELRREEITELYRRLPLHTHFHNYELTPSTHLLNVLAECMKYARVKIMEEEATATDSLTMENPIINASDAECGFSAKRDSYVVDDHHSPISQWHQSIAFYDALFPILDALADLEEIINGFEDKTIDSLFRAVVNYENKVRAIFAQLKSIFFNERNQKNIDNFKAKVLEDIILFNENIESNNQPENTQALLSNHIVTNGIFPLGLFVVEQVERVATVLAQFRRVCEEYPGREDYIEKSEDCKKIDVLIEDTLAFKKSFAGIRFSTAKSIPKETITVLRVAGGNCTGLSAEQYDVILNDFIKPSEQADYRVWIKLFSQISGNELPKINKKSLYFAALVNCGLIVATPAEVGLFFPVRIFLVLVVGIITAILNIGLSILNKIKLLNDSMLEVNKIKIQNFIMQTDMWLDFLYNACSLVGYLREKRDNNELLSYRFTINDAEATCIILAHLNLNRKNSIAYFVKENFKSSIVNKGIVKGYESIINFFYDALAQNPSYLGLKLRHYVNKKMGYSSESSDVLITLLNDLANLAPNVELNNEVTLPLNKLWQLLNEYKFNLDYGLRIGGEHKKLPSKSDFSSVFPRIQPNKVGPSESIMGFAEVLGLEFSSLINGVYIKMPLASTVAMLLAFIAWYITCTGSDGFVPEMMNWLSEAFTGEGAISFIRITLASFLFWKLATVTIEAAIALYKRDAEFLEKLYGDPERLFLGFSSFLGLGIALQFLPLLPDAFNLFSSGVISAIFGMYPEIVKHFMNAAIRLYPAMANIFIIEARVAWHGQIPLNFLEYFFLGLKAVFLFGAVVSGEHKPRFAINEAELAQIIFELNYLLAQSTVDRPRAAHYIVRLYGALGLPIERRLAQNLFDELSADKRYIEISKDLYNQTIFRGSNNLLQILFILPGIFITYPYRAVMYGLAHLLDAPVIKHGIEKNFAEDLTMFIQVAAAMSEVFRTFLLGTNQLVKSSMLFINALCLFIHIGLSKICRDYNISSIVEEFPQFIQYLQENIQIHNAILYVPRKALVYCVQKQNLNFFKSGYSQLAHVANTDDTPGTPQEHEVKKSHP